MKLTIILLVLALLYSIWWNVILSLKTKTATLGTKDSKERLIEKIPGTNICKRDFTVKVSHSYSVGDVLYTTLALVLVVKKVLADKKYVVREGITSEEAEIAIKHFKFLRKYNLAWQQEM